MPRALASRAPGAPRAHAGRAGGFAARRVRLHWPEVRPAALADIERVHSAAEIGRITQLAQSGGGWVDPDTFVVPVSYDAALLAAGGALQATDDVLAGRHKNAFVIVRPPGHHASRTRAMGFCLFNNVAVAAQWALDEGGTRRVAVLDVDVHHGNGTQDIFFDRPDVLYYSTHQYPFYPGTGRVDDVGRDDGVGTTVNVPLAAGSGDDLFLDATRRVLVPAVRRFRPDVILVSLGFDAHWADPLAQMQLTTGGYRQILAQIVELADDVCDGKLVSPPRGRLRPGRHPGRGENGRLPPGRENTSSRSHRRRPQQPGAGRVDRCHRSGCRGSRSWAVIRTQTSMMCVQHMSFDSPSQARQPCLGVAHEDTSQC